MRRICTGRDLEKGGRYCRYGSIGYLDVGQLETTEDRAKRTDSIDELDEFCAEATEQSNDRRQKRVSIDAFDDVAQLAVNDDDDDG